MVDLQSLPLPLYLVLLVCLMPYGIVRNVWRRFIARAPISPNISPSSYTPLPSPLLSPPLSVPYTHHFVNTPNSRVHYISTAKPASTNAPSIPLLFVHGFPDFWYEWRHQLNDFAPSSQCLAIDLRGFGYSEVVGVKDDRQLYTYAQQCRDVVAVLDAEKIAQVLIVGHDWGGAHVWQFARRYPHRLLGVASLCTPYLPRRQRPPLLTLLRVLPHWSYQVVFAYARDQVALNFEDDVAKTQSLIIRSVDPAERIGLIKSLTALSLLGRLPLTARRSKLWTAAELRVQTAMFEWSGFKYPLLQYHTLRTNLRQLMKTEAELGLPPLGSSPPPTHALTERITVPALMMPADGDAILQPVLCDGMERWCDDYTRVDIRGAGHWAQLEQPDQVNAALASFIEHIQAKRASKSVTSEAASHTQLQLPHPFYTTRALAS